MIYYITKTEHLFILKHSIKNCTQNGHMSNQKCSMLLFSTASVIKWGRGEGETLSIHVVSTWCAVGLILLIV